MLSPFVDISYSKCVPLQRPSPDKHVSDMQHVGFIFSYNLESTKKICQINPEKEASIRRVNFF